MLQLLPSSTPLQIVTFLKWWTTERGLLLVAVISAIIALWTYRQNSVIERNANRPMMCAEYVRPAGPHDHLRIKVSNKGKSVAKNVSFTFDPPLPTPKPEDVRKNMGRHATTLPIDLVKAVFCRRSFETWVPGYEAEALLWIQNERIDLLADDLESAEGVPAQQGLVISFEDDRGRRYTERFVLDVKTVLGFTFRESSDGTLEKNTHHIHNELEKVNDNLSALHTTIDEAIHPPTE